jgi:hypothetical protein
MRVSRDVGREARLGYPTQKPEELLERIILAPGRSYDSGVPARLATFQVPPSFAIGIAITVLSGPA